MNVMTSPPWSRAIGCVRLADGSMMTDSRRCANLMPRSGVDPDARAAVSVPRIVSARSLVRRSVLVTSGSLSTGWREQIRDGATEVVGELPRVLDGSGPVPLAGDIADVGLRQADGVRDGHVRDSRRRGRLRHAVGASRGARIASCCSVISK